MQRANGGENLEARELLSSLGTLVEELAVASEELNAQTSELAVARDELLAQDYHYRELFEAAPLGYLVTAEDGTILECNRIALGMLNMREKFLIRKPLSVFVTGEDRRAFGRRLASIVLKEASHCETWETKIKPRDGEPFHALINVRSSPH